MSMNKHCLSWLFLFCFLIPHPRAELTLFVLTRESVDQNEFLRRIRRTIIILGCYTKPAGFGGGGSGSCFPP